VVDVVVASPIVQVDVGLGGRWRGDSLHRRLTRSRDGH